MTYSRKLGTASPNANPPMLKTPIVGEVDLGLIMPMISGWKWVKPSAKSDP